MTTSPLPGSLTHRQIMLALSGLMIGMFIAAVDQTIVATAIPAIVSDLGGIAYLSWIVVGYLLTSTASTPLWGKVGDLFGRRRMFQTAIVIFLIGSLMCGLAPSMLALIVGRLVQGVGGGGLYALCFGIVGDLVPPRQRGKYISYFAGMFAVAGVIGPLIGGVITDSIGWRWIFTINIPIGLASLVVTSITLHLPSTRREAKVDILGAVLLVAGVTCLVLATAWGGDEYPWGSVQIIGLSLVAVAPDGGVRGLRGAGPGADPAVAPLPQPRRGHPVRAELPARADLLRHGVVHPAVHAGRRRGSPPPSRASCWRRTQPGSASPPSSPAD